MAAEGELLLVGQALAVKDQQAEAVHPGFDGRHLGGPDRLADVGAGYVPGEMRMGRVGRPDRDGHRWLLPDAA